MMKSWVLVADADVPFLISLRDDSKTALVPVATAESGRQYQTLLADQTRSYYGVFLSITQKDASVVGLVKFTHLRRPGVPIFLIKQAHDVVPFTESELRTMGIHKVLDKPINYLEMLSLIVPLRVLFDPDEVMQVRNHDALNEEVKVEDAAFFSVQASTYLAGNKSFFDLYLRLSPNLYVKVIKAGDTANVNQYLDLDVQEFFIRYEVRGYYVAFCERMAAALLASAQVSSAIKVGQVFRHGAEVYALLRQNSANEQSLQMVYGFVSNVHALVIHNTVTVRDLLSYANQEHAIMVTILTTMLAQKLGMKADKSLEAVGIAAALHDIGLYKMPAIIQQEDESKMTPDQVDLYHSHPDLGSQIAESLRGLPSAVSQAIAQHHVRHGKHGFPAFSPSGGANRIAEMIGITDDFVRIVGTVEQEGLEERMKAFLMATTTGFSDEVVTAFKGMLVPE